MIDSETQEVLAKGLAERIGVAGGGGKIKHGIAANGKVELNVEMADHEEAMDHVFALLTDPEREP